jgi:O-antigen/teichoic acid export membrane protein
VDIVKTRLHNLFEKILRNVNSESGLIYLIAANLISNVIGAALWLYVASALEIAEFGELGYYFAIGVISSNLSLVGMHTTITTYYAKGEKDIVSHSNIFTLVTSAVASCVVFVITFNPALTLFVLGYVSFTMSLAVLLGQKAYKKYARTLIAQRALQMIISIVLLHLYGRDGFLLGYTLAFLAFGFVYFKSLFLSRMHFNLDRIKQKKNFAIHSMVSEFTRVLNMYSDKFMIAPLFGFLLLGKYQLAIQFLLFLYMIPASLFSYLLPQFAGGAKSNRIGFIAILASVGIAIASFILLPYVIALLFPKYIDSSIGVQIISFAIIPLTVTSFINSKLLGTEKSKPVFIATLIYLTLQFSMVYILGQLYDLVGLAFAVIIALAGETLYIFYQYVRTNDSHATNSIKSKTPD